jgi:hypothetical protein
MIGWLFNAMLRPFYPRERNTIPIVQGVGWASGTVWTGSENLTAEAEENHEYQSSCSKVQGFDKRIA